MRISPSHKKIRQIRESQPNFPNYPQYPDISLKIKRSFIASSTQNYFDIPLLSKTPKELFSSTQLSSFGRQNSKIKFSKKIDDYISKVQRVRSQDKMRQMNVVEKCKSKIGEIREKLSQYSRQDNYRNTFLNMEQNKSNRTFQIKKDKVESPYKKNKTLKETVSTTATNPPIKSKILNISHFKVMKMLGQGKFSKVYLAKHKATGLIFALKVMKKQLLHRQKFTAQILKQIKIQSFLNHPNITKLYTFFDDKVNVYLVLQYCQGKNLYEIMKSEKCMREDNFRQVLRGVCQGIKEMHEGNVLHRDVKPENIIISFGLSKLADFGWSSYSQLKRETFCGTPLYLSPQQFQGQKYGKEIDIWPLGIIMYQALVGKYPFKIYDENNVYKIVQDYIHFPKTLSIMAADLMKIMLERDPKERVSVMEILEHPFLQVKK